MTISHLGPGQIVQEVYDPAAEAIRVVPATGVDPITGAAEVIPINQLVTSPYDYISLTNQTIGGEVVPVTIVYKTGGSSGTVVATLTLTYDGAANLLTVSKV